MKINEDTEASIECKLESLKADPPAFPVQIAGLKQTDHFTGISRLEYFAAAALANLNLQAHVSKPSSETLAESAFSIAEAMCAEADKRREKVSCAD